VPRPRHLKSVADEWAGDRGEPVVREPSREGGGRSALAIIQAHHDRALARAASGQPAERAAALAEARRLVNTALAIRGGLKSRGVAEAAAPVRADPELRAR
jgi:hypothetical protein